MGEFGDVIQEMIQKGMTFQVQVGTVSDIDSSEDTCTITPSNGGPDHLNAKLRSIVDSSQDSKMVVYPKGGSKVAYVLINNDPMNTVVVAISEFDGLKAEMSNFLLEVKNDGTVKFNSPSIVFNDGNNGGLVTSQKVYDVDDTLITKMNQLVSILTAWVPVPNDGGAALKTALLPWLSSILPVAQAQYENTDIKH